MIKISSLLGKTSITLLAYAFASAIPADEKFARKYLSSLSRKNYYVLSNLLLNNGNRTTQIDNIVVSPFGIFVIEEKNHRGNVFGAENSPKWKTYYRYAEGQKYYEYQNPLHQNLFHISALKKILPSEVHGALISVISFTETPFIAFKGKLENNFIVRSVILSSTILSKQKRLLSDEEVQHIVFAIKNANIQSTENLQRHIEVTRSLFA